MFGWLKKLTKRDVQSPKRAERITRVTNSLLERVQLELKAYDGWRFIPYGDYSNKPVLSRVIRYILELSSDAEAIALVVQKKVVLDGELITNPNMRLHPGDHTIHLVGLGNYTFTTKID